MALHGRCVQVCNAAARAGHEQVLHWLMENGCQAEGSLFVAASEGGHLHVMELGRQRHVPWKIAQRGSRGLLGPGSISHRFFHQRAFENAATGGSIALLDWLYNKDNCNEPCAQPCE